MNTNKHSCHGQDLNTEPSEPEHYNLKLSLLSCFYQWYQHEMATYNVAWGSGHFIILHHFNYLLCPIQQIIDVTWTATSVLLLITVTYFCFLGLKFTYPSFTSFTLRSCNMTGWFKRLNAVCAWISNWNKHSSQAPM